MAGPGGSAIWLGVLIVLAGATGGQAQAPLNPPHLSEPPPQNLEQIDYSQTLVRRLAGNPDTLNPLLMQSAPESALLELLYDTPFVFGKRMDWGTNKVMVRDYRESDDHLTATLLLKEGLKWHDGHPFTAADIVFSFEQLRDPQVPACGNKLGLDTIVSCEAIGDYEVRFVHRQPSPISRINISFPIVARHVFAPVKAADPTLPQSDAARQANRHPLGNGPYRFVEWDDDELIVLERWEGYPGPKPFFKRIEFRIIRDQKIALSALLKGEIHETKLTPGQFTAQLHRPEFARVAVTAKADRWSTTYIGWNMDGSNPFFNDVRVRQAMSHALDADQILKSIYYGLHSRSVGIYPPGSWMFNPAVEPLRYSLAKAGDLLDQAKWRIDPQTGWRVRDGVSFEFELLCPSRSSIGQQMMTFYQQALRSIGVNMKLRMVEYSTLLDRRQRHEFQSYYGAWVTSLDPDQDRGMFHSHAIEGGANYVSYRNKQVDALFDKARRTLDFAERQHCYREIHRIVYEDQPFTFVGASPTLWAFNKHLHGVQFSPRGVSHWHPGPRNWWVKQGDALP
ncbi:MAG: hypothetical protein KAV82_14625 [Phycisphaerae bacterium]|nr:hypothetical protein [Phycisphaerae bacterium]